MNHTAFNNKLNRFLPVFTYFLEQLQQQNTSLSNTLHTTLSDMYADWVNETLFYENAPEDAQSRYAETLLDILSVSMQNNMIQLNLETIFTAISYFSFKKEDILKPLSVCIAYNNCCSQLPVHFFQMYQYMQQYFREVNDKYSFYNNKVSTLFDELNALDMPSALQKSQIKSIRTKEEIENEIELIKKILNAIVQDVNTLVGIPSEQSVRIADIQAICEANMNAYIQRLL